MRVLARSSLVATLLVALAPSPAPAVTTVDPTGIERNVPYGAIAAEGLVAARSGARARQLTAASRMPYFAVTQAAAATSMEDTSLARSGQAAPQVAPAAAEDADVEVDPTSGPSASTWLLGGAAFALVIVALLVAMQPRWQAERSARASRDRRRAR